MRHCDAGGPRRNATVLTATENGFGKRTPIVEYTRHGRGTKGMIAIQTTARNGKVVAAVLVEPDDEIMLITTGGVLVRTRVSEIREMGRATQGVTLISVDDGSVLSGVRRVVESDIDDGLEEIQVISESPNDGDESTDEGADPEVGLGQSAEGDDSEDEPTADSDEPGEDE